jgi:acetyl/propionyl-CoA carboxylase alpha subunit
MIAKVIAWAPTREQAAARSWPASLRRAQIHG